MSKRRPSGDGMVRKRDDGRWEGRIVVGHKENGDPIFRYIYADTQKELTAKLRQHIDAYDGVELTEQSQLTLGEWLNRWLNEYMAATLRPTTVDRYRRELALYVRPYLGQKPLTRITAEDVRKLYRFLQGSGRTHSYPGHGDGLSTSTIHGVHSTLHHALRTAEEEGLIPFDPTEQVAPPKVIHSEKTVLTREQVQRFLDAAQGDAIWYDFFYTELTTGLRRGEICGLKWEDFDEKAGVLKVRRTLHKEKGGVLAAGGTKTYAGTRDIILPSSTAQLLKERKRSAISEWIFPNPLHPEQPMNPSTAYNRMKVLLAQAGLPDIRFHDLRHTFATQALASGVDAKTLAGILGHTNASFTLDAYTHTTGDMQERAAEIVGAFMTELLGDDLNLWQNEESPARAASG